MNEGEFVRGAVNGSSMKTRDIGQNILAQLSFLPYRIAYNLMIISITVRTLVDQIANMNDVIMWVLVLKTQPANSPNYVETFLPVCLCWEQDERSPSSCPLQFMLVVKSEIETENFNNPGLA